MPIGIAYLSSKNRKNLVSGFESKKQVDFCPTSRFFEGDAAHRVQKTAKWGRNPTFFDQNISD
jgi:hypothetical protein